MATSTYSYRVEHFDNGEVFWSVSERCVRGEDVMEYLSAYGFSHAKWVGGSEYADGIRVGKITQAHCEAFDAIMRRMA
jgi:hypothetical protein